MSHTPDPSKPAAPPAKANYPDHPEASPVAGKPGEASARKVTEAGTELDAELPGSAGNNSLSVSPKDVMPGDASARDLMTRHLDSTDPEERQQERLDDANDLSFPASDPPAVTGGITRIERPSQPSPP